MTWTMILKWWSICYTLLIIFVTQVYIYYYYCYYHFYYYYYDYYYQYYYYQYYYYHYYHYYYYYYHYYWYYSIAMRGCSSEFAVFLSPGFLPSKNMSSKLHALKYLVLHHSNYNSNNHSKMRNRVVVIPSFEFTDLYYEESKRFIYTNMMILDVCS